MCSQTRFYRNKPLIEAAGIEEAEQNYDEKFFLKNVLPLVAGQRGRQVLLPPLLLQRPFPLSILIHAHLHGLKSLTNF